MLELLPAEGNAPWAGKGLPGEPVREMVEAVEKGFGDVEAIRVDDALGFLRHNGGAYIADQTRSLARQLGFKPVNTATTQPHGPERRHD